MSATWASAALNLSADARPLIEVLFSRHGRHFSRHGRGNELVHGHLGMLGQIPRHLVQGTGSLGIRSCGVIGNFSMSWELKSARSCIRVQAHGHGGDGS